MHNDYLFWETVYRCLMSVASAIKKYKLEPVKEEIHSKIKVTLS